MPHRKLHGKVVVVTGASSGFGRGAALRFAEDGAAVVLAARRGELLEELARECQGSGAKALAVPTDVSRREQVERLAEAAVRAFGRFDVWVNDAGVGALGRFERIPLDVHEHVIRTDLLGTLYGSYFAYRQFLKQKAGTLINIASQLGPQLGQEPGAFYTSYSAAKHGVVGLTESLRLEAAENKLEGIRIRAVLPTAHDTPFFEHAANYTGDEIEPPKPLHNPQDVIDTIVRLAHDPDNRDLVGAEGIVRVPLRQVRAAIPDRRAAAAGRGR